MGQLNIRNVPDEAMRRWKAEAAGSGVTLREWVLERLGAAVTKKRVVAGIDRSVDVKKLRDSIEGLGHHPQCKCLRCKPKEGR